MKNKNRYKKEFSPSELTEKAFEVYSNSDLDFYEDRDSNIYIDMQDSYCSIIGDLKNLEQLLMEYGEE